MQDLKNDEVYIENIIYEIRGKQVMLDRDLARLYKCKNETKTINQAVNRNIVRFPDDFYFELNELEFNDICGPKLGPQNMSLLKNRVMPKVFTEQGVAMLASVLRTDIAAEVSVNIMRAFAAMRKYISNNLLEQKYINNQVLKNAEDIKLLQKTFENFNNKKGKFNEIFLKDRYLMLIQKF